MVVLGLERELLGHIPVLHRKGQSKPADSGSARGRQQQHLGEVGGLKINRDGLCGLAVKAYPAVCGSSRFSQGNY